ncbi:MAG TPA: radical SAM protein [Blastocatellia bacterium]|nr:radical SAM protein [Blastocatellia bacterium]HMV82877.1 radical SAM protein [Blastocatellia bacterium]HMZ22147.1 radical SAM protein [Blastocatellia bacterium]HNG29576.1 radical SAM protein [Blastocatellia bacterium]
MSSPQVHVNGNAKSNGLHTQTYTSSTQAPADGGKLIVLTAPLTETIDHAGYFIQMGMASMPIWMEGVMNKKYPHWREVEYNDDGSARYMPAGVRLVETSLLREYKPEDIACCYPDDLEKFVGPNTRVVAVSTHNPLGVTFAAGVYTSIFGSSKMPINSHYSRLMFEKIKTNPHRQNFKVIVGGSGGWQITQTNSFEELGVDCVVEGRSESEDTMALFRKAISGEELPREIEVGHPKEREALLVPDRRTTFGVVEMTTGCGRRCQFCVPDLNPQIDFPKDKIMTAVRANVREGNKQISLATEDMFIWGQVHTETPFYFPNREALLDLYSSVVNEPGVEQHVLSHSTIAPAVVDPVMIEKLSELLLPKSPIHLPYLSNHPQKKALSPLIGLETGSPRLGKKIMPSKGIPFSVEDWPSVVLEGLAVLNRNNWFPVMTLIVGAPDETDEDVMATLDLVYEMERRGLFAFLVPSIFTPLHDTRMQDKQGVAETRQLSPLQWQLLMKCWKLNLRPGLYSWWGPMAWRTGALALWAWKLRKINGPNFTWPLLNFAGALPESWMEKMGKIYVGKPLKTKSRKELLATIRPAQQQFLREDCGDLPDGWKPHKPLQALKADLVSA